MSETRVQAATLVCKIFLRYLDQLPEQDRMLDLWLKILDILDRMMNSGQGDSLVRAVYPLEMLHSAPTARPLNDARLTLLQAEAIPESVKNILLLMADGGYLAPPSQDPSKEKIWVETRKRLDRFVPDLFTEIFPETSKGKPVPGPSFASSLPVHNGASNESDGHGKKISETAASENTQTQPSAGDVQ